MTKRQARRRPRDYVERQLRGVARRARVEWFGIGLFLVIGGGVLLLVLAALLDSWLILDDPPRKVARGLLVAAISVGLGAALLVALRRARLSVLTEHLERERPEFKDSLLTYVQMRRGHRLAPEQRQVLRAVGKRAARLLAHVDPEEVMPRRAFGMAGGVLAAALGIFLLLSLAFWTPFVTSVRRVLVPGSWVPPATATRIRRLMVEPACGPPVEVLPAADQPRAVQDSSCTVTAFLAGEVPSRAVLFWRPADNGVSWRSRASSPVKDDTIWRWKLDTGRRDLLLFLAAGDVRSERFVLRLIEPPGITSIRIRHEPPAYTGLASHIEEGGDITALVGTRVTITASTDTPVAARAAVPSPELEEVGNRSVYGPVLRCGSRLVPMAASGTTLTATLTVEDAARYRIHFPTTDGFWNRGSAWHTIRPLADQPPSVAIVSPQSGRRAPLEEALPVRVRATDDVGVTSLELLVRRHGRPAERIPLPLSKPGRTVDRVQTLDLGQLKCSPGDRLELSARAADGYPGGRHRTDAASVVVRVAPAVPVRQPR